MEGPPIDPQEDGIEQETFMPRNENTPNNTVPFQTIPGGKDTEKPARKQVKATPWVYTDPAKIARREWVYPSTFCRKFVTATVAPGGVGKTGLGLAECLEMVTGRNLLKSGYQGEKRKCWYWNGEDPQEEMDRQIHAALIEYDIQPDDIGGRLFIDSGRETQIRLAYSEKNGFSLDDECIDWIKRTITANEIDVAIFDPLVSIHQVPENSNESMDAVVKALGQIANDTNSAIAVAAHTRKQQAGASGTVSSGDARGGSALMDGARITRVLNPMTAEEGVEFGKTGYEHKRYFWCQLDKANLTPPADNRTWFFNKSVVLPNGIEIETPSGLVQEPGDSMRVVTPWQPPGALDGMTVAHLERLQKELVDEHDDNREDARSPNWTGLLLAEISGQHLPRGLSKKDMTPEQIAVRSKMIRALSQYVKSNALKVVEITDEKTRKKRAIYIKGEAV